MIKKYCRTLHTSINHKDLISPSIVFSNHHLLAINKPPGWHSVPIANNSHSKKCLLTKLKNDKLGGGSTQDFLLPLHRIDQPCTGIIVFAKNSKAARRIHSAWKKGNVEKEYLCVVENNRGSPIAIKYCQETGRSNDVWHELSGFYENNSIHQKTVHMSQNMSPSFSDPNIDSSKHKKNSRNCHIRYQILSSSISSTSYFDKTPSYSLLRVITSTGARHQIRAMLSQLLKHPIAGDLRYGAENGPLPDQSVSVTCKKTILAIRTVRRHGIS